MDAWIDGTLKRLVAVSPDASRAAMHAVDGIWWDSTKRIPDWTLVRRRQFEIVVLRPWRMEDASPQPSGRATRSLPACRDAEPSLVLQVPDGFAGVPFREYLTLEIEPDDTLLRAGFPRPHGDTRIVTQEDFPAIVEMIRVDNARTFGPGADAP
jgi:hypothetical protein